MEDLEKFGIYHETYFRLMRMKIVDMSRLGDLVTGPKNRFCVLEDELFTPVDELFWVYGQSHLAVCTMILMK